MAVSFRGLTFLYGTGSDEVINHRDGEALAVVRVPGLADEPDAGAPGPERMGGRQWEGGRRELWVTCSGSLAVMMLQVINL